MGEKCSDGTSDGDRIKNRDALCVSLFFFGDKDIIALRSQDEEVQARTLNF